MNESFDRIFSEFSQKAHGIIRYPWIFRNEFLKGFEEKAFYAFQTEINLPRRSSGGLVKDTKCDLHLKISSLRNLFQVSLHDLFEMKSGAIEIPFFEKTYSFSFGDMDSMRSLVELIDDIRQDHFQRMELESHLYNIGLTPIGNSRTVFLDLDDQYLITHTFSKEKEEDKDLIFLIDSQIREKKNGSLLNGWKKNLDGESFIRKLYEMEKMIVGEDYIDGIQALAKIPKKLKEAMIKNEQA